MNIWPSSLNHLADQGSWSYKPVVDNARTDFDQGPARVRRRFTSHLSEVDFTVIMTGSEFEIFKTFVWVELLGAARWFSMVVFTGREYTEQAVRFRDAKSPYDASDAGFNRVKASIKIEVRGGAVFYDSAGFWFLSEYGEEFLLSFHDDLQQIVNVDYPSIF